MEANESIGIEAYRKLQEENSALREENEQLWRLVRALEPFKTLVSELEARISELEGKASAQEEKIEALEEKTQLDSHNSNLPPSSDRFKRPHRSLREKSGKKPGGQEGHAGRTLCQVSEPDEVVVQGVEKCDHCQADLQSEPVLGVERRQEWDLPPKRLLVREYQAEQKWCPHCQQVTPGAFPEGITAPVQYGPALGAVGVYLVEQQLLP